MEGGQQQYSGDSNSYNQPPPPDPQMPQQQRRLPAYNLSAEELHALKECNRESLLFRSIPMATVLSSATYYAIANGYLMKSPRMGYFPKMAGAILCGIFLGRISYRKQCMEKLLRLPDSKLAEYLRKNGGIGLSTEMIGMESGLSNPDANEVFTSIPSKPIFDDHKPDERDRNEGLEEYQKVTDSLSEYSQPPPGSSAAPVASYDDRRRSNREEYGDKLTERYRRREALSPPPAAPALPPQPSDASPYNSGPKPIGRRNQYGDIVYDE